MRLGQYRHSKTQGLYEVEGLVYAVSAEEITSRNIDDTLFVINATDGRNEIIYKDKDLDKYYVLKEYKAEKVFYLYMNKDRVLFIRGVVEFHEDVEIEDVEHGGYNIAPRFVQV